jgi:hypothetical protein
LSQDLFMDKVQYTLFDIAIGFRLSNMIEP